MAEAKTYAEYLVERQGAVDETVAELKLAPGSTEKAMFGGFVGAVDRFHELFYKGDAQSRNLARLEVSDFNARFYSRLDAMKASQDPDERVRAAERASAATVDEAIGKFSGKLRGPSIFDRLAVEPYYDQKKKEWKPFGLLALAGGLGLGLAAVSNLNLFSEGFSFTGLLQAAAIIGGIGLLAGGILPPAAQWVQDQFTGKKPEPAPSQVQQPAQSQTPGQNQQQSQEQTAPDRHADRADNNDVADQLPARARRDALRSGQAVHYASGTRLGSPGYSHQLHIPYANQENRVPYIGASIYSPTGGVLPSYNTGNYIYGPHGNSPTVIPRYNGFGYGNNGLNGNYRGNTFANPNAYTAYGGNGYNNVAIRNGNLPWGMNNGGFGLNTGVANPYTGMSQGHYASGDIAGTTGEQADLGRGFVLNETVGMKAGIEAPLAQFIRNYKPGSNPLATDYYPEAPSHTPQPPHTPGRPNHR